MKITRTMPDGSALHITAQTDRGYFSVTADWPSQRAGGCLHAEVALAAPWLAPIIALHLSDAQTGAPMHAEANGFYWLAGACGGLGQAFHGGNGPGARTAADCERVFAEHARLSVVEARGVVVAALAINETRGSKAVLQWFAQWIAAQAPRWAADAAEGRALLASKAAQYAAAGVQS